MAKLCLALDTNFHHALDLIRALRGYPLIFKVGYKLFIAHHRAITDRVKEEGFELFLDLKLHDIPNTVREGVFSAKELGADYLTLHISSGRQALKEAVSIKGKLKLLGVSVLTSLEEADLKELGVCRSKNEQVYELARVASEEGLDGVVCSGQELELLKGFSLIKVVPGIRLEGEERDDQKRVVSLEEALEKGADVVVMGRSILRAENPVKKVEDLLLKLTMI